MMRFKMLAMHIVKYRVNFVALLFMAAVTILSSGCSAYYPSSQKKLVLYVTAPYIELRKAGNSSSEIFYVIEKNEHFSVLGYSGGFFVIETMSGIEGWVSEQQLLHVVDDRGRTVNKTEHGLIKLNSPR